MRWILVLGGVAGALGLGVWGPKLYGQTQHKACASADAGFRHSESVQNSGDKTLVTLKLSLVKAPYPLNFDAYVFEDGILVASETNIPLHCGKPALRTLALPQSKKSIAVVYTRHIDDKLAFAKQQLNKGEKRNLEPRILSDALTVRKNLQLKEPAQGSTPNTQSPNQPISDRAQITTTTPLALSRVGVAGDLPNQFATLANKMQGENLEVGLDNEATQTRGYQIVCLKNNKQMAFADGKVVQNVQLPPRSYARLRLTSKTIEHTRPLQLVHCYELGRAEPIWPLFILDESKT
jgi:hypothetical protein